MLSALTASRCFDETEKGGGVVESPCTCGLQPNRLFGLCLTTTDCLNYYGCRSAKIFSSEPFITRRGRYIGLKNYWTTLKHAWKKSVAISRLHTLFKDLIEAQEDQLFSTINHNPQHLLHCLLPPPSAASQIYDLRHRAHTRSLPDRAGHLVDSNFISRITGCAAAQALC